MQVAEAPNIQVNRVATIRELDQELNKHSALMMLDNKIDLKCLTRVCTLDVLACTLDVLGCTWDALSLNYGGIYLISRILLMK